MVCHNIQQRLAQFRWLKSSGICLAVKERMHHISSQIVGDNPKGEIALFSGGQVNSCQIVWLLGVDYVLCTSCTAAGHRLSGSLLWVYVTISIFRGVGLRYTNSQ